MYKKSFFKPFMSKVSDDIDFDGGQQTNPDNGGAGGGTGTGNGNPATQPDTTDLTGGGTGDINDNPDPNSDPDKDKDKDKNKDKGNGNQDAHDLEEGTTIEFDGNEYTVDANGNIVDKDGNIFKEAKDVKAWLEENNASDSNDETELSIENIRKQMGIDITDDKGNAVEFTNDVAGVKSYIDSVVNLKSDEIRQGTINKFFNDNPVVKQFVDYMQVTGTYRGFGELPDRSGIQIDKDNKEQQKTIIKIAAEEFGNKSLNDNYIKYLESTGGLYDEAKAQLEALQKKDKDTRTAIEKQAAAAREQERQDLENYFNKINEVITSRKLGGYTLPENIVKERNGQKVTLTLNDFFDYVAKSTEKDEEGNEMTGYQRDLNNQSDDELLYKELIDAWLMFTGGSYKDLVNMAVNEDNVRRLVIKSKENRNKHNVNVRKPNKSKGSIDDIIF